MAEFLGLMGGRGGGFSSGGVARIPAGSRKTLNTLMNQLIVSYLKVFEANRSGTKEIMPRQKCRISNTYTSPNQKYMSVAANDVSLEIYRHKHKNSNFTAQAVWDELQCSYGPSVPEQAEGQGEEAIKLYLKIQHLELKPDSFICSSLISTAASLSASEQGKQIHVHTSKFGLLPDVFTANSLVNVYAGCGNIDDANRAFSEVPRRPTIHDAELPGCNGSIFAPQLHESAGGLPKTKLVSHSCSLAGSTSAMKVSNWGGHLHFREVGE
ncbi:pentatricopeptide repeat-containing protein [Tanacetum coccineum]|uniref:Pentatricopeptide repeat-containing protein n=1 Tax=Tanacetum coccineum TaxID=301880 RepID=A0ABQ5BY52_9ASTR